ncbi:MAG: tRNA (N(6)-L-threonylcarbamoyladenosine(37)-C(2))-methylthiotransferase MtaB [Oscillospiraceae bacterium]|nr:tRNA (N(6)-L-threonylcarbamoyladenosine(37)-C(2))-methylthiotransferase MtaB [Oscillospiraceae bacterium]
MRFSSTTLGCKVNQCDTNTLDRALAERGHERAALGAGCDLCIVNTCSVTAESVRKSRQAIRRIKRQEQNAIIAVCGCYSELEPDEINTLGVDFVSGTGDKAELAQELEQFVAEKSNREYSNDNQKSVHVTEQPIQFTDKQNSVNHLPKKPTKTTRTRAFLKIQDGCDNYCAYCIIPYARGHSRSEKPENIIKEAEELYAQGYKEIVITGIEISSFGKDLKDENLISILKKIAEVAPKTRLRIGSLDPTILTEKFCADLAKIPSLCNHFHISLQSGSNETLARMGRKYKTEQVKKAMESLRKNFKDCAISADLITGFPGEISKEFKETLEFLEEANFSTMHIFPFSPRPRTKAAEMQNQVEKPVSKERAKAATETANQSAKKFKETQIGKTAEVLFEQKKDGHSTGHTTNYIEVKVKGEYKRNSIKKIKLTGIENNKMTGIAES